MIDPNHRYDKLHELMKGKRIEQVAIAVPAGRHKFICSELKDAFQLEYAEDHVTGDCSLFDNGPTPADSFRKAAIVGFESKAHLSFLYGLGFELEILTYENLPNWHMRRLEELHGIEMTNAQHSFQPFLSHLGMHVDSVAEWIEAFAAIDIHPIQRLQTKSHTNPYLIKNQRTFKYVIFDTYSTFGFDFKVIERIERK